MTSRLAAVLLDFDGLLADTEDVHSRLWRQVLCEHGVACSADEYADHWIRRGEGVAEFLRARSLGDDVTTLLARKLELYLAAVAADLQPMPGALAFLDALDGRVPLALVTSGRRAMLEAGLARLGIGGRFAAIVTYEMVQRPKPHPEPFLAAAAALGVDPARCVALDDAEKGVVSAADAGAVAVAVPNAHTRGHDFSRAALVVPSLSELTLDRLAGLVASRVPQTTPRSH
jgi:HAD superfamily hydrolase (TIGR01509 family)